PDLFAGAIYAKAAFEMWNDLKETYDKVDGSVVFNLNKSINSLNQNGSTLAEYYNNLNSLWRQFEVMINLPPCTREATKHFEKHNQLIKLMQFLMGLDESYLEIRSNIITKEPLPLVKVAITVFNGEESHRNATFVGATKPAATPFETKTFDNNRRLIGLLNDNGVSYANANMVVGHPNGTQALITKIGDLKINNDITLYDALAVPKYTVSLLYFTRLLET
nr:ribonuclease H-like domain-containing protein [Tanacetum cinerariifolium]